LFPYTKPTFKTSEGSESIRVQFVMRVKGKAIEVAR